MCHMMPTLLASTCSIFGYVLCKLLTNHIFLVRFRGRRLLEEVSFAGLVFLFAPASVTLLGPCVLE